MNCPIRERTGDGVSVGRCWFHCPGGICPRHGDVNKYLERLPMLTDENELREKYMEPIKEIGVEAWRKRAEFHYCFAEDLRKRAKEATNQQEKEDLLNQAEKSLASYEKCVPHCDWIKPNFLVPRSLT